MDGRRGKLLYIDLSKYQNKPPTEIVASMWNHSAQIQKAVGEAGFPWPQFKKGEMGDLLEFMRNPEKR
jgi:hypothetical protein